MKHGKLVKKSVPKAKFLKVPGGRAYSLALSTRPGVVGILLSATFLIDWHLSLLLFRVLCARYLLLNFSILSMQKIPRPSLLIFCPMTALSLSTLGFIFRAYTKDWKDQNRFWKRINPLREFRTFSNLFKAQCQSVQPTAMGQAPKL